MASVRLCQGVPDYLALWGLWGAGTFSARLHRTTSPKSSSRLNPDRTHTFRSTRSPRLLSSHSPSPLPLPLPLPRFLRRLLRGCKRGTTTLTTDSLLVATRRRATQIQGPLHPPTPPPEHPETEAQRKECLYMAPRRGFFSPRPLCLFWSHIAEGVVENAFHYLRPFYFRGQKWVCCRLWQLRSATE